MHIIYIDADACPVKDEVYRVARRYAMRVRVVANSTMRIPAAAFVELIVRTGFGGADDWIAEQAEAGDIAITADIPLAARCLEKECAYSGPEGIPSPTGTSAQRRPRGKYWIRSARAGL